MFPYKRFRSMSTMLALLVAVAGPAAAYAQTPSAPADAVQLAAPDQIQAGPADERWLPWLGCWELVGDAVDYRQVEDTGRRVVCIAPRLDGLGVNLTTQLDDKVIAQNTVVADARPRGLAENDCSGEQTASWSADGRRLHSFVNAACAADAQRSLAGLSMLVEGGRWIELQSVSFDGGEHRELVVRQYDRLDNKATTALGFGTLSPALAAEAARARAAAAGPLDVDDVLEASETFAVEVVEAAILESNSTFALGSNELIRLADAGIEDRVIDLMVAISFPDRFVVDSGRSGGGGGGGAYGPMYVGFGGFVGYYPSCWGAYYSPFWGPYGPGCDRYFYSPYYGYGSYRPPYYGGGGRPIRPSVPPSGSLYGGKVINKRGYATVSPVQLPQSSSQTGVGGAIRRAFSRNGGNGERGNGFTGSGRSNSVGSGRSTGGSTRSAVTRSGFTRSGSGGSAPARSSSSGATKARAKAKAKPKGGGGGS
jgi:hypothetical protein